MVCMCERVYSQWSGFSGLYVERDLTGHSEGLYVCTRILQYSR